MVKAPSSHGLDRKFKAWRKGKSQNSKRRTSLKQQLRGLERCLQRATDDEHKQGLQERISALKQEIAAKQNIEKERQNAKQSHGARFLERQKLVRAEKNIHNLKNMKSQQKEMELTKIALDQVYVAHYPMDIPYLSLYRHGVRRVDLSKVLGQRAKTRQRILAEHFPKGQLPTEQKGWISKEQYGRVAELAKKGWTRDLEKETFGEASKEDQKAASQDDRFQVTPSQRDALLAAADQIEAELDEDFKQAEREKDDDSDPGKSSASSGSSSDDQADPLRTSSRKRARDFDENKDVSQSKKKSEQDEPFTEGSDSSSSSSSDDDSSVSSSGSASENEDNDRWKARNGPPEQAETTNLEDDDFLVPADSASDNVFAKPKERMAAIDKVKGDKSQGWKTQRQRPSQYKQNQNRKERRRW